MEENYTIPRIAFHTLTDNTGRLRFRYVASQFGGVERITARLVSDTTKFDTLSVKTRVPGLQLLPDGANYDLVGGTCKHHGPDDDAPIACQTPDNNHYAAQIVRDSLPLMANVWADNLRQRKLDINDISLPYGGMLDVSGQWRPEHSYDREGLEVDVRTERPGRAGVKVRNAQGKWMGNSNFEKLGKKYGVKGARGQRPERNSSTASPMSLMICLRRDFTGPEDGDAAQNLLYDNFLSPHEFSLELLVPHLQVTSRLPHEGLHSIHLRSLLGSARQEIPERSQQTNLFRDLSQ